MFLCKFWDKVILNTSLLLVFLFLPQLLIEGDGVSPPDGQLTAPAISVAGGASLVQDLVVMLHHRPKDLPHVGPLFGGGGPLQRNLGPVHSSVIEFPENQS